MADESTDSTDAGIPDRPRRHRRRGGGALRLLDRPGPEADSLPRAVRGPGAGHRHLVCEHLHRVRRGLRSPRPDPRGPRHQARGQSRSSGQRRHALRAGPGRPAGAVQPRPRPRPEDAPGRRRLRRHPLDDAIAELGRQGHRRAAARSRSSRAPARGTFSDLLAAWTTALGGKVVRYQPFDHEPMRAANRQVFGVDGLPAYDFASAEYIVSFGADFLETWLAPIENQRGFAAVARLPRRRRCRGTSRSRPGCRSPA